MAQAAVIGANLCPATTSADTSGRMPKQWLVYGLPLAVAVVALCQAALLYQGFLESPRQLWIDPIHDRNAHYWLGLNFGLDLRHADLPHFIHDLHSARAWPPLHALLVGLCLTVGGIDYRLAVLPSLLGWVGTAVFAFLAARRAVSRGGNAAGLVAALFVLVSPAHRAFATDIMLESLGACLTVAALYAYLAAVQERTGWAGRCLGLALTALFFEKYNYWLLVVFGLVASEILARRQASWRAIPGTLTAWPWRAWLRSQWRHPLTYPLVVLLAVLAGVIFTGGGTVHAGRHAISLHSPHNLVTVFYALLVLRLVPWW
ncbi:MAG TPA: hypothetical protein VFA18_13265, partial [Gemmataceae bacterium]|nr:hypothetical protein [Gemmataceae bacterium]